MKIGVDKMLTIINTNLGLVSYKSDEVENIFDYIKEKCWIHVTSPSEEEIKKISSMTRIDEDMLKTVFDEEELAHFDIDGDITLIVVDIPIIIDGLNVGMRKYNTTPFGVLFNNDYIVTTSVIKGVFDQLINTRWMKNFTTCDQYRLTCQILYSISARFVNILKQLDKDSEQIQKTLNDTLNNKELYELIDINKSLVYILSGLNANYLVLTRIKNLEVIKNNVDNIDFIEDAIIENRQAYEMGSIHKAILTDSINVISTIVSNNVNTIMKTLTNVTIILAVPTLVASFFGMNFDLPFYQNVFLIVFILSLILSIISAVILIRYTNGIKKRKKKKEV